MNRMSSGTWWTLAGMLALAGCGSESDLPTARIGAAKHAESGAGDAGSATAAKPASTANLASGATRSSTAGPASPAPSDHPVVAIETSLGTIEVELDRRSAPLTVFHFLDLAASGHYRDNLIHYVEAGQMIVGGGYDVDRRPTPPVAAIRSEADNGLKNVRGTIAMSRQADAIDSGSDTFFINLADAPNLDHHGKTADTFGYCVFGKIIQGLELADRMSAMPTTEGTYGEETVATPVTPIVIKNIRHVR